MDIRLPPVAAFIMLADMRHYGISEPEADNKWNALTPNNGIIYLVAEKQPFTLSMFHQMWCLDIICKSIRDLTTKRPSELDRHCLNYLQQMVLCSSATEINLFAGPSGKIPLPSMHTCNNWSMVYSKVHDNID